MQKTNPRILTDEQAGLEGSIRSDTTRNYFTCYYVDELGFYRHLDPDQLHYVCSNLNATNREASNVRDNHERGFETHFKEIRNDLGISHFDRMEGYKEWKEKWDIFLRTKLTRDEPTTLNQEFKSRIRSGIPHDYRCKVWSALIRMRTQAIRSKTGPNIYLVLKDLSSNLARQLKLYDDPCPSISQATIEDTSEYANIELVPQQVEVFFRQIELDLLRTLPNNRHFESQDSMGIQRVRRVLRSYSIFNPAVGYCQGMNRLAAVALLVLPEDEAFWCLVTIVQGIMPKDYYLKPWLAQVDCRVLNDLVERRMPALHKHLSKNDIQLTLFTWFFTIYVDGFRPELMLRIWDCFLLEGDEVLFRFALAILYISQDSLMRMNDFSTMSSYLCRLVSTRKLDVEYLFEVTFNKFKPISKARIRSLRETHRKNMEQLFSE